MHNFQSQTSLIRYQVVKFKPNTSFWQNGLDGLDKHAYRIFSFDHHTFCLRICTHHDHICTLPPLLVADDESDPEASEFDLGTKIKTPKDVMLEELSLLNNKGSKMFKMRQQRVEKFIVSNENNVGVTGRKGSVCLNLVVCADQTLSSPSSFRRTSRTCSWLLPLFRQSLRSQRKKVG